MHLHIGACVPHKQWIGGDVPLQLVVQKHLFKNPNEAVGLEVQFEWKTGNTTIKVSEAGSPKVPTWDCSKPELNLTMQVYQIWVKTVNPIANYIVPDGLNSLRIRASSKVFDGIRMRGIEARIRSWTIVNNGGNAPYPSRSDYFLEQIANTGFPWAYTHAELRTELPTTPIRGNWTFKTDHFILTSNSNTTHSFVSIDPAFHQPGGNLAYLGIPIFADEDTSADGVTVNPNCPVNPKTWHVDCSYKNWTLDTTQLSDGYHKLFLRTDSLVRADDPLLVAFNQQNPNGMLGAGTFSAVTLVALRVDNNNSTETSAPDEYSGTTDNGLVKNPKPPAGVVFFNGSNAVLPNASQVLTTPVPTCEGWLEPRVYQEAQSWFTLDGLDIDYNSTHLHIGACLPYGQMIAGKLPLDIQVQKHYFLTNPNISVSVLVSFFWKGGNVTFELIQTAALNGWNCEIKSAVCKQVLTAWIDTWPESGAWRVPDGLQELRLEAKVGFFDGFKMRTMSTMIQSRVIVANLGAPGANASNPWNPAVDYTKLNLMTTSKLQFPWAYTHAHLEQPVPLQPVGGLWTFKWSNFILTNTANITSGFMSINPGFHKDPVVLGSWYKNVTTPDAALCPPNSKSHVDCKGSWTLDTNTLANGWHRLFIRADSFVPQNDPVLMAANAKNGPDAQIGGGTFSSIAMTAFRVYNVKPPPPPSPPPPSPPPDTQPTATGATVIADDPSAIKAAITDDLSSAVQGTLHGGPGSTASDASDLGIAGPSLTYPASRQSIDQGMGTEAQELVLFDVDSGKAVAVTGGSGAEAVAAALTQAVQRGEEEMVAAAAVEAVVRASNVLVVKRLVTEPQVVEMNGMPVTW